MSMPFYSQQLFYQDVFYGGVTGGGFSSGVGDGASGQIIVNIDPTSTIRKAYLLCVRYREAQPVNITLNFNTYIFNNSNQVGSDFNLSECSSFSTIHAIDITNDISPLINTYNISIPNQITNLFDKYGAFYLVILYENSALPKTAVSVILNEKDVASNVNYQFNNLLPIDTLSPVGLAIHSDILWDTPDDGSFIFVNNNNLGIIQGSDNVNSIWSGAGVKGHFYYQNNTLFGLDDDTSDSLMNGTDGLADIKSYIPNNTTNLSVNMVYENNQTSCNIYLAYFLTYTTPCDTFTTTATTNIDTICKGESVQLSATGGVQYSWFSAFSTFNDSTLANPIATPSQTTTYIVTIKNDSGCVKTEHVKIWVNPLPKPDTIVIAPQTCGSPVGSLQVGNIANSATPFTYQLTNLTTSNLQSQLSNTFTNLLSGNYLITITDNNGCTWQSDTLFVPQINNVVANFNNVPQAPFSNPNQALGKAPMEVSFYNTSQNANTFLWTITQQPNNDTILEIPACAGMTSSCGLQHFFTQGGAFEVCLIAYNNQPQCADTVCKTIFIDPNENVSVFIPNVFTPNGDNENDNFVLQITGTELLESLEVEVFNRWGQQVQGLKFDVRGLENEAVIWDGTTTAGKKAPEGTYFYVVTYKTKAGETITEKGTVSLLR